MQQDIGQRDSRGRIHEADGEAEGNVPLEGADSEETLGLCEVRTAYVLTYRF